MTLLLWSCVLMPGKFVSTLDIRADHSFTFTYVGDVWAVDLANEMTKDAPMAVLRVATLP